MRQLRKEHWISLITFVWIVLAGSGLCARGSENRLWINEIMASNSSVYADPQLEDDDWIEIYNANREAVDLGGMYLTDDLDEPTKWRVPLDQAERTTIPPRGHLLIWADNDLTDGPELHAGFSINAGGEAIALFDSDGVTLIDSITFGEQRLDVSFGRYPDGNPWWRSMIAPTPGAANVSISAGFVEDVRCSHDRGFYEEPITVTLTTDTPGAEIWFSTNGAEPNTPVGRWVHGTLYTGPIQISRTTCLRAKAYKAGWEPSTTRTYTYIFSDDILRQSRNPIGYPATWGATDGDYEMDADIVDDPLYRDIVDDALLTHRTVSLTFDMADLFDPQTGIYVNPQREGEQWERAISMEIIDPAGGPEIQLNAGLQMQGGASRNPSRPKHNMRLLFKGQYGPSKLEFPMFEKWPVQRFNTLVLRGGNGDSWIHPSAGQQVEAQYIRDQWPRDTQLAMGQITSGQCYVHLYLNGLYWGLYHVIERPDAAFFAEHFGGDEENYDILQHKNGTVSGNRDAWIAMMAVVNAGLASVEAYTQLQQYINIPNLIDYMLLNFYIGNVDWDHNNWYGGRERVPGAGFRFFAWDSERTFLSITENRTGVNKDNQPSEVHQGLTTNAEYRVLFADHVHRHFFNDGALTVDSARERWLARAEEIRLALVAESARWGDAHRIGNAYTPDVEWQTELDFLTNAYMPQRTDIVLGQLKNKGLYPSVEAPSFNQHGGPVANDFLLNMIAPAGTIWYTTDGSDPRVSQTTQPHVSEQTLVAESAFKRVFVPTESVDETWRTDPGFNDVDWINGAGGVGYDTGSGYESYIAIDVLDLMHGNRPGCYIRVPFTYGGSRNDWEAMVLRIRYDDGFVAYLNGIEIARRNVNGKPSWDSLARAGHPDAEAVILESIDVSASMSHLQRRENLLAIHGLNRSLTSSDFLISAELKVNSGYGTGGTVHPEASTFDGPIALNQSMQVKARTLNGSTWSALNEAVFAVGPVAQTLRISELMYHPAQTGHPDDPNTEYVELTNIGLETINLNLVAFTNGVEFTFPGVELMPGAYCLVVKDIRAFESRYGDGLNVAGQYAGSLDNAGERLELQDAFGQVVAGFKFRDDWYDMTDGSGFSLVVKDPATNEPEALGQKSSWQPSAYDGGSPGRAE